MVNVQATLYNCWSSLVSDGVVLEYYAVHLYQVMFIKFMLKYAAHVVPIIILSVAHIKV